VVNFLRRSQGVLSRTVERTQHPLPVSIARTWPRSVLALGTCVVVRAQHTEVLLYGAIVQVVKSRIRVETDAQGGYTFRGLAPGSYWELAFESKRVFDLKRWGQFYDTLSVDPVAKLGLKPFHVLMPIPQYEMDLDPALVQNPGY